jgi:hypothetical protein
MKLIPHAVISAALISIWPAIASADVVTDWNRITIQVSKGATNLNDGSASPFTGTALNTNLASRIDAIESIAVYNAVNAILRFGTAYGGFSVAAPTTASTEAAAAQAARNVLVYYYPSQTAALDSLLATSLSAIPDGQPKTDGIASGAAAAAHIIGLRASDGSSPNVTYPGPGVITPGAYQLTPNIPPATVPPFTFNPGINQQWAGVTPFVLTSPSQFRPSPPPALNSAAYFQALNQAKTYGTPASPRHTAELEHITQFYKQDAEVLDNEAARLLSISHSLSLADNALLFVTLDTAIADTRIAEWEAKYFYLFWRPITALNADSSGTVSNNYSAWKPAIVTPSHPSYPSGHSGTVVAIEVLRSYFGDFNTLTLHTTTAGEPARTVSSLTQIEAENGLSRIYGGIHFSFDNSAGQALGRNVASYVLTHGPQANP